MAGPDQHDRRDSWKEIGAYLGRGVTTVQRWEQLEGLPVRRLPHAKRGSVFAFKHELDAWLAARARAEGVRSEKDGWLAKAAAPQEPHWEHAAGRHEVEWAVNGRRVVRTITAAIVVAVLFVISWPLLDRRQVATGELSSTMPVPLANEGTNETAPTLSPNGNQVAYSWRRGADSGIYIKDVAAGKPIRLSTGRLDSRTAGYPKWSPRGDVIAFQIPEEDRRFGVYISPAEGGEPRRLTSASGICLCWLPDGTKLGFIDRSSTSDPFSVYTISVDTLQRSRLTEPPLGSFGDTACAFSFDGNLLAVSRFASRFQSDVYVGNAQGSGPLTRVTRLFNGITGLVWAPDGSELFFGSHNGLWRVPAISDGAMPARFVADAGITVRAPSFAMPGERRRRLVYERNLRDVNLWRWDASSPDASVKVADSTWWEDHPALSPDGGRIVFASNRTGANELWIADHTGANAVQLTFQRGSMPLSPRWSPDGRQIAFSAQNGANRDLYLIQADGSRSVRLTQDPAREDNPSWSRDGRWLYFRSDRGGANQIWRMRSDGSGRALLVTAGEASQAFESVDGKRLYFVRGMDTPGLWSVPPEGGDEVFVLPNVSEGLWGVAATGIAFIETAPADSPTVPLLRFFDLASGNLSILTRLPSPPSAVFAGFAVSTDARSVYWTHLDSSRSDLMLIDPKN